MNKEEFERQVIDLWVTTAIPLTRANLQHHTGASAKQVKELLAALASDGTIAVGGDGAGDLEFSVPGAARPAEGPRTFAEKETLDRLRAEVAAELTVKQARAQAVEDEQRKRRAEAVARKQALVVAAKDKQLSRRKQAAPARRDDDDDDDDRGSGGLLAKLRMRDALEVAGAARQEIELARGGKPVRAGRGELATTEKKHKSLLWAGGLSFLAGPLGWLYAGAFRETVPVALLYLGLCAVLVKLPSVLIAPLMSIALPVSGLIGVVYAWQYNRHGKRQRLFDRDKDDEEA